MGWSQITASDSSGCAPLVNIAFTSPPGATGINWDFDDGASSNLASPVHTFNLPGTYTVVFTATISGNPVNYSLVIDVYGKPNVNFGATPPLSGCIPLGVSFSDSSTGGGGSAIVSRQWAFGDGGVNIGNNPNPFYTYTLTGSFNVSLKVTDALGCDSAMSRMAFINTSVPPNPVITTSPAPPTSCLPPLVVSFSGAASTSNSTTGPGLTYLWDFGSGNTSTLMNPPVINYTNNGIYPISLVVSDNNNCSATAFTTVVISAPVASFFVADAVNDTVCSVVHFQNLSTGFNPLFSYGDGTFGADTFHTYLNPGTYQVNLQVSAGSCLDDTTITIVVENVVAAFTTTPSYSCSWPVSVQFNNQSINGATWIWEFADGTSSTSNNPVHTLTERDTNQYTIYYSAWIDTTILYITSVHGCKDTVMRTDTIHKPTARFMPDVRMGCAPLTVIFSDSSISVEPIVNYKWLFGDGNVNNGVDTVVTHTYTLPGVYNVRLVITNSIGCIDTSFIIEIYVGEPSIPTFSVSPIVACVNTPVQFTDLTPAADSAQYWHYTADGGTMSRCYTNPDPMWLFNATTGLQDITLTTLYNGCAGTTTIPNAIEVKGPLAHFIPVGDCATPMIYTFEGDIQDSDYWTWDFGDGTILTNSTTATISHTYTASGDYSVALTAFNNTSGCAPYTDSATVNVRNINASFLGDSLVCANQPVIFDATGSTDVHGNCHEGYLWYWGDDKHPDNTELSSYSHIYDVGGNYSIKLVTKDINGCIDTVRKSITVYGVEAYFKPNKLYGCLPLNINFTDSSFADTTITQWQWYFGDGTTSTLQNPSHTYTQVGITFWTAKLVVTTSLGCKDSMEVIIQNSIPDDNFYLQTSSNICAGDSVRLIAISSIVTYNWDFGNGTSSTIQYPWANYPIAGVFTVTLTVTDSIGCTNTNFISNVVSVQNYPVAAFVSSADTLFNKCYPLLVSYTDTSLVNIFASRTWDLGNGASTIGNQTVGTIYQAPGTYSITLIETTTNGCRDTVTKTITVEGPVGDFDIVNDTICKGQSITFSIKDTADVISYMWDFGDGTTAPGTSPITHTFNINPVSGQTMVSIVMWSPDSACTATHSKPIYIYPVVADFSVTNNDTIYCLNEPLVLNNLSLNAGNCVWTFGDGTTYTGTTPPPHTYSTPGNYNITLSISNAVTGCSDTLIRNFDIFGIPDAIAIGGDTCQGDPIQIFASGGISYLWTPATGLSSDTIADPIATPNSSTNYLVTMYDVNGCSDTAYADVIIYEPITAITFDTIMVIGQEIQLNVYQGPGYNYTWTPATGLSCITCPNPIAQPLVNTIYYVTIEDDGACFTAVSSFEFEIKPITTIDVPTAFTPDGDGDNDVIFVRGLGIKRLIEFKVYNRWGQLLFETDDIDKGWDGFYMGKLQNIETYVYFASVETWLGGEVLTKKGSFNLLR